MPLLHLEPLPRRTTKGDVLHAVVAAGLDRDRVGKIDLRGATAVVEVPAGWEGRLAKALDGTELNGRRVRAWSTGAPAAAGGEDHFQRLARLLVLESEAEARRTLEMVRQLSPAELERSGAGLVGLT